MNEESRRSNFDNEIAKHFERLLYANYCGKLYCFIHFLQIHLFSHFSNSEYEPIIYPTFAGNSVTSIRAWQEIECKLKLGNFGKNLIYLVIYQSMIKVKVKHSFLILTALDLLSVCY